MPTASVAVGRSPIRMVPAVAENEIDAAVGDDVLSCRVRRCAPRVQKHSTYSRSGAAARARRSPRG